MRYAIVSETYPPEINGVALTVQAKEQGLRARGHEVELVRPRQSRGQAAAAHELLVPGLPIPGYPSMRFGLPALRALHRHWRARRPDAIYIATEGPLGWSALRTARRLGIAVATGFHTRFEDAPGTNPEELIAAAHAGCFTMALSFALAKQGITDARLETTARVTLVPEGTFKDDLATYVTVPRQVLVRFFGSSELRRIPIAYEGGANRAVVLELRANRLPHVGGASHRRSAIRSARRLRHCRSATGAAA